MVFVSAREDDGLCASDVTVDDGALLSPCIALVRLPVPRAAYHAPHSHAPLLPLLWIAGLGLESLWLSLSLPSLRVAVLRECSGLNLGAHASSCAGDVCRDVWR